MSQQHHVLVTGCSGAVGRPVCAALRSAGHRVRGLDLQPNDDLDSFEQGDIADSAAVARAVAGVDRIVHLAANPHDQPFVDRLVSPNVIGLYHVFDQARAQGVPRVIFASSMQVVGRGWKPTVTPERTEPRNHYALTKLWAEQMGRMYAVVHGIEMVGARIGWLPRNTRECEHLEQSRAFIGYLSPGDAGRFFKAAVEALSVRPSDQGEDAPPIRIVLVVGPQRDDPPMMDLTPARALGYEPEDVYPQGLDYAPPQG